MQLVMEETHLLAKCFKSDFSGRKTCKAPAGLQLHHPDVWKVQADKAAAQLIFFFLKEHDLCTLPVKTQD